jgi:hypothetical protein
MFEVDPELVYFPKGRFKLSDKGQNNVFGDPKHPTHYRLNLLRPEESKDYHVTKRMERSNAAGVRYVRGLKDKNVDRIQHVMKARNLTEKRKILGYSSEGHRGMTAPSERSKSGTSLFDVYEKSLWSRKPKTPMNSTMKRACSAPSASLSKFEYRKNLDFDLYLRLRPEEEAAQMTFPKAVKHIGLKEKKTPFERQVVQHFESRYWPDSPPPRPKTASKFSIGKTPQNFSSKDDKKLDSIPRICREFNDARKRIYSGGSRADVHSRAGQLRKANAELSKFQKASYRSKNLQETPSQAQSEALLEQREEESRMIGLVDEVWNKLLADLHEATNALARSPLEELAVYFASDLDRNGLEMEHLTPGAWNPAASSSSPLPSPLPSSSGIDWAQSQSQSQLSGFPAQSSSSDLQRFVFPCGAYLCLLLGFLPTEQSVRDMFVTSPTEIARVLRNLDITNIPEKRLYRAHDFRVSALAELDMEIIPQYGRLPEPASFAITAAGYPREQGQQASVSSDGKAFLSLREEVVRRLLRWTVLFDAVNEILQCAPPPSTQGSDVLLNNQRTVCEDTRKMQGFTADETSSVMNSLGVMSTSKTVASSRTNSGAEADASLAQSSSWKSYVDMLDFSPAFEEVGDAQEDGGLPVDELQRSPKASRAVRPEPGERRAQFYRDIVHKCDCREFWRRLQVLQQSYAGLPSLRGGNGTRSPRRLAKTGSVLRESQLHNKRKSQRIGGEKARVSLTNDSTVDTRSFFRRSGNDGFQVVQISNQSQIQIQTAYTGPGTVDSQAVLKALVAAESPDKPAGLFPSVGGAPALLNVEAVDVGKQTHVNTLASPSLQTEPSLLSEVTF